MDEFGDEALTFAFWKKWTPFFTKFALLEKGPKNRAWSNNNHFPPNSGNERNQNLSFNVFPNNNNNNNSRVPTS